VPSGCKTLHVYSGGVCYSLDRATGKELHSRVFAGIGFVAAARFNSDASSLALATRDGILRVVDPNTEKEKFRIKFDNPRDLAFSSDRTLLAVCTGGSAVQFLDAATGARRFQVDAPMNPFRESTCPRMARSCFACKAPRARRS